MSKISIIRHLFLLFFIITLGFTPILGQPGQGQRGQGGENRELPRIGKLTGKIVDNQSGEPLMYASVVLNSKRDSTMVSGAITNESGHFTMEQLPPGMFFITVNYIGYPPQNFNDIRITFREPEFDLGTVQLEPSAQVLDEVTVEAARSLMETGLDRRVINVNQELTSIGGTGIDIMQNIPSVAVDFDGNVSLRGSTNVTILIDGRPSTLTGLSGSEALQQIPAEMIERVEVITNPSARYNPEGTSGIINVVLKEHRRPGYNGMVSLNAGSAGTYSGSVNLNYKVNDWNFFTNYSARLSDMDSYGNSLRETFFEGTSNFMDQDITGNMGMGSHNVQAGIDYNFNSKNTLTLSSRYSNWNRNFDNLTEYILYRDFITNPNSLFLMDNDTDMLHNSFTHQMNFRRTFDQRHRELTADLVFSTRNMDRNENFVQQFFEENWDNPNGLSVLERTQMIGQNWSLSSQLDYAHPLGDDSKFETGYRIQLREMDSDFKFEHFNTEQDSWMNEPNRSNHFIYNEQIFAAYGMYATMLGKFSLQAGLRAEQTFVEGNQVTIDEPFSKNYLNLFPTMHIRRSFENNQSAQISYTRRINRPNNRNLNPFMRYSSEYEVSMGNPDLDPEFINSFEIGYTRFWNTTTLNPSIFYRQTEGMITRFSRVVNDLPGLEGREVTLMTFENLNRGTSYGAELVVNQRITDWWNMNGTFSYFRSIIDGAQMELESDSYSWSGRFVSNMNLGSGWNMQVNGFYRSPIVMLNAEIEAMYMVNAGVRKNIWGNTGSISLNISDIFNTMKFSLYNYGDNFTMNMDRWRTSRVITLGFTYRINEFERRNNNRRMRDNGGDDGGMDFDVFEM
ncbi:MAG: TonB-dependent receptor [Bacteroidetes bacterium]|nr:MAG: TonB-dependent receptor [Bacteroidota bacterium]